MPEAHVPTSDYAMNHTMLRIKDPKATLKFYEDNFGMKLLKKMPVPELGFTNYFIAFNGSRSPDKDKPWYERQGVLELCHNHGAEDDPNFKVNNGNVEPYRNFGHIAVSVDNIQEACQKLEENGVKFQKKLSDGRQKDIAFALDPDGYWIELITNREITPQDGVCDKNNWLFNHQMIRIKDKEKSLKFYTETLGMKLLATKEVEAAKFTLFFLGFNRDPKVTENSAIGVSDMEGLIELTYNWNTEADSEFAYHDPSQAPQGFGHFGITVDDVKREMDRLESAGVRIKKRMHEGKIKFIGFIADPDGYPIEILPRADIPDKIIEE